MTWLSSTEPKMYLFALNSSNPSLSRFWLQPSVAKRWHLSVVFMPSEDTAAAILKVYKANRECRLTKRIPFTEIPRPTPTIYNLSVYSFQRDDVFTRHPISRVVTRHRRPFADLPQFTLSAHPCVIAETGCGPHGWGLAPPIYAELVHYTIVHCFCNRLSSRTKPRKSRCVSSSHSSPTQSSMPSSLSSVSQSTTSSCTSVASLDTHASANPTSDSVAGKRKHDECCQALNPARPQKIARQEREGTQFAIPFGPSSKSFATSSSTSASHLTTSSHISAASLPTFVCSVYTASTKATSTTGKRKRDDCSEGSSSTPPPKAARRDSGSSGEAGAI
ncbi:hypothetical protein CYLTODRAFT_456144 [Cylindrobasidium torrendii FP15055 ss-10]|uniref:Uncharacterized protein n=1 Tax=Cylindrobasidium torrendii FP15055 ss-10 TaxID=1314674 RepID=A0A0D7B4W5_9AGAR|nr:hypothetical protein CYLTODRAFT_456144 [Cylindrobasidium torrendii FP15055 ss-10]